MIIIQSFPLQHREAIDQETKTAHTPLLFCIPHLIPGPLLFLAIFFINGSFVILSPNSYLGIWSYLSLPGYEINNIKPFPWTRAVSCSHSLQRFGSDTGPLLLYLPQPPTSTSNFKWVLKTATIWGRAEGREEGALNKGFIQTLTC